MANRNKIILIILLFCTKSFATVYSVRSDIPHGSSRVIGLGGAYVGLSEDVDGMYINPAGSALSKFNVDFTLSNDRVEDGVKRNPSGMSSYYNLAAYNSYAYALSAKLGRTVVGIGMAQPIDWNFTYSYGLTYYGFKLTSTDVLLAYALTDQLSLGVLGRAYKVTQSYSYMNGTQYVTQDQNQINGYTVGLAWRNDRAGVGITYSPQVTIPLSNANVNANVFQSDAPFRDSVIPGKSVIGIFSRLSDRVLLLVDNESYSEVTNGVEIGATTAMNYNVYLMPTTQQILRLGLEYKVLTSANRDVTLRVGSYSEPQRVSTESASSHVTAGLEARFGPAKVSIAYDQATSFTSTAQGLRIELDNL